ncbi:PilN domain-containing protein [Clostridium algidicarnis]|uniref:PilN domain-containing protein n=1 Tax=Clostridium algidicarnis TaxID=37659 RepID=UPI001C0E8CF7|nr:PilN domain-containing protein [Clostridium algidicarnis]MBU3196311.1 PilN domain-containing protein [Clostridium algidicarnis]MCB2286437.1 PilN domain-containing protein [Clostridium algidicarnis]
MKDFNFFLPYLDNKKGKDNKRVHAMTALSILGILVVGSLIYNTAYTFKLKYDIKNLQNTYNSSENQEKLKEAEALSRKYEILDKYYENVELLYNSLETKEVVNSKLMFDISKSIPKEVSFKTMSIDSAGIQIQGLSENRVAIGELEHNLKNISSILDVHVNNINSDTSSTTGGNSFSLKCTLKGVDKNEDK